MRLVCLADTHNLHHHLPIPDGDVLIHAGDCTDGGSKQESKAFLEWFSLQKHKHKILVPGNHDFYFEKKPHLDIVPDNIHVLIDKAISIDGIYFCPHTPQENCKCRKPEPGLLLKAVQDLNIDLEKSLMIGDSEKDVKAAENAGCKGILLNNNQKLIDVVKKLIL